MMELHRQGAEDRRLQDADDDGHADAAQGLEMIVGFIQKRQWRWSATPRRWRRRRPAGPASRSPWSRWRRSPRWIWRPGPISSGMAKGTISRFLGQPRGGIGAPSGLRARIRDIGDPVVKSSRGHIQAHDEQQDAAGDAEGRHRDAENFSDGHAAEEEDAEKHHGKQGRYRRASSRRPAGLASRVAAANSGTLPTGSIRANRAMKKLTESLGEGHLGVLGSNPFVFRRARPQFQARGC